MEASKFENGLFFEKVTFFSFSHTSNNVWRCEYLRLSYGWEISLNQSLTREGKKIIFELNYEQISIQLILKRKVKTLSALTRLLNKDEGTFFLHVDFSNYYSILHTYKPPFSRVLQTSSWFTKKVILTVYLWWKKKFIIGNKKDAAGSRHNSHPKYNFMMIIFQMCIWFHGCFNKRLAW